MKRAVGLLLAAVVLAAAAGAVASLALFALAIGLVIITVGTGASVLLTARRLAVTRSVPQREVCEDQPISVRFDVRELGWPPLPVHLEARVGTGCWVPLGESGGTLELMVGRPGAWQLSPSRLRLRDDLGIFERSVLAGQPEPLHILPAPDLAAPIPPQLGSWDADPEPDGLQPYLPGAPIGRIHWPALARGAELQQRRLAAPPTGPPLVLVDTTGARDPRAVDWVARVAAGVIVRLARSGGCQVVLPGDRTATAVTDTAATWCGVHRRLALLGPANPASRRAPLWAGQAPEVHIRAADVPAELLREEPWPLPPGVVAVTSKGSADP